MIATQIKEETATGIPITEDCCGEIPAPRPRTPIGFYAWTAITFAISLVATIYFCVSMSGGMNMPGGWTMSMMWMRMPGQTWMESAAMFLAMWLAMMVAMMLPSALPMLLRVRQALAAQGDDYAGLSTVVVAVGYFGVWLAIGIAAYIIGIPWALATMKWPGLSYAVPALTGVALVLAGALQFSRWKNAGLGRCRDPLSCGTNGKLTGLQKKISHGFSEGISCVICCSGPMIVLLALGAMDPIWMFVVGAVIFIEKVISKPQFVVYITGALALLAGTVLMVKGIL